MRRWHTSTPFTSMFNNIRQALNWAGTLERWLGPEQLFLMIINTYCVPRGNLWDAYVITHYLGFPTERLAYHEGEYLHHGPIGRERVLKVFPVGGGKVPIPVHLGQLLVPQVLVNAVGSSDADAIKDAILREVEQRHDWRDHVLGEQTVHALCSARSDDLGVAV